MDEPICKNLRLSQKKKILDQQTIQNLNNITYLKKLVLLKQISLKITIYGEVLL